MIVRSASEKKPFVPLWRFFPNIMTLIGLCSGLTAIKYTFNYKWEASVIFILIAAVIDGMDGRIARILDSSTEFGAHLDSLADLINFGVAPGLLIYFYSLVNIKVLGWAIIMVFVMCMTIRLARFNVENISDSSNTTNSNSHYKKNFFVGIPAPIGALLLLFPVILSFNEMEIDFFTDIISNNYIIALYSFIISVFVVSRVPTFSAKNLHISSNMEYITTFIIGIVILLLSIRPWTVIPLLSIAYLFSIPVSVLMHYRLSGRF